MRAHRRARLRQRLMGRFCFCPDFLLDSALHANEISTDTAQKMTPMSLELSGHGGYNSGIEIPSGPATASAAPPAHMFLNDSAKYARRMGITSRERASSPSDRKALRPILGKARSRHRVQL